MSDFILVNREPFPNKHYDSSEDSYINYNKIVEIRDYFGELIIALDNDAVYKIHDYHYNKEFKDDRVELFLEYIEKEKRKIKLKGSAVMSTLDNFTC